MSTDVDTRAVRSKQSGVAGRLTSRILILVASAVLLILMCMASLVWGSSQIPLERVWYYLWNPDDTVQSYNINGLRGTRTIIGIAVGLCLAVAGAIMQAITRNPLADPGLCGVTSGASLAIVLGTTFLGFSGMDQQFLLAMFGAAGAAVLVYIVGAAGGGGVSPVRLVLAGVAFSAASGGIVSAILLKRPQVFDSFRYWNVGSLTRVDVPWPVLVIPIVVGLVLALSIVGGLSDIALGDDVAAALGTNVVLTRSIALLAITLLCAAATAAAGPLSYVGLVIPLIAQWLMGSHRGWIMALCVFLGPILVLTADVIGRLIARPAEIAVGSLTAFVGAPVLLYIVHRMKGESR